MSKRNVDAHTGNLAFFPFWSQLIISQTVLAGEGRSFSLTSKSEKKKKTGFKTCIQQFHYKMSAHLTLTCTYFAICTFTIFTDFQKKYEIAMLFTTDIFKTVLRVAFWKEK